MHEFAPSKSRPSGNCPSDVELAAYIDGVLGKEEAARVTEHLASCERCFEVYTETVHFQLESQPAPVGKVVPFPWDQKKVASPWWRAVAAAAVLVVAIAGYLAFRFFPAPPPQIAVAEVTPNLGPDLGGRPIEGLVWNHNRYRGSGASDLELALQSFQVGALLVDFHLAGQMGAAKEAYRAWHGVGRALAEAPGMSEISNTIFEEANQIDPENNPKEESSDALRSVAARAGQTEAELRDSVLFPEYLDFGKWTEAGRIAALAQDASFFNSRKNRRFLSYALETWKPEKPKEVRKELQAIERIWAQGEDLDPKAFEALAGHFQAILDQYDFRA